VLARQSDMVDHVNHTPIPFSCGYFGDGVLQFWLDLHYTLITSPPSSLPLNPLPAPLKAIARGFIQVFEVHQPYTLNLISFIPLSPPTSTTPNTLYLFYSTVFHSYI
jgi:hypothetical protein